MRTFSPTADPVVSPAPAPTPSALIHGQVDLPVVAISVDTAQAAAILLASLLFALLYASGIVLVVYRCAYPRRRCVSSGSLPPPKGLGKRAIDALIPTVSFAAASESSSSPECAICLAGLVDGEAVRALPRCDHAFHVACVDAWLQTRATCPSCRAAIVVAAPASTPAAQLVEFMGATASDVVPSRTTARHGDVRL